jgi:dienelactone hydrolase
MFVRVCRILFTTALLFGAGAGIALAGEPVSFPASDGLTVDGDFTAAQGAPNGVILLFHQAGSNRAEYAPIAPRLAALGWSSLAIDQRSGGGMFGHANTTAAHAGRDPGYAAALPDLEGALAYAHAKAPGQRIVVWGSSYSAALVFVLAAKHPGDIEGVLAFSPGEYIAGASISGASAKIHVPIFVTSASDRDEEHEAAHIIGASPASIKVDYVPSHGVHGSSTLREDRNPAGAAENWRAVEGFLAQLALPTH